MCKTRDSSKIKNTKYLPEKKTVTFKIIYLIKNANKAHTIIIIR